MDSAVREPGRAAGAGLAGRGIAELILHGRYTALDLTPLSPARFREGTLILEDAIV